MKAGLEIHQQLNTGKLFCRCPSRLREDSPDVVAKRFLRPVASEIGDRDLTSETEAKKKKTFSYEAYSDSTCLVEIDEEPPKAMDSDALGAAIAISKALNCKILPEIHTMRKAIIDGSCPSGFQRTALVSRDGFITVSGKRIGIEALCIEEDAGRIVASDRDSGTFRLDRLGIPLVEITTAPDISSPDEAKEAAKRIGTILRLTGHVARGLGTIRQDINISIDGGERVELKGVQNLSEIPEIVRLELERQRALNGLSGKYSPGKFGEAVDVSRIFSGTASKVLSGKRIIGRAFFGLAGIMKEPLGGGMRFGKEVADKVKALTKAKGFFHTDELPNYGVTEKEVALLREALSCGESDLVAIVASSGNSEEDALEVIGERLALVPKGVLAETRKANPDNTTSFLRPISGASRFYPETDVPPVGTSELSGKIKVPETPEERISFLKSLGLSDKLAGGLLTSEDYWIFQKCLDAKIPPVLGATIVEETYPYLRRKGANVDSVPERDLEEFLSLVGAGKIHREGVSDGLEKLSKGERDFGAEGIFGNAEEEIRALVSERADYVRKEGLERSVQGLMGVAMAKLKGKMRGSDVKALLEDSAKRVLSI